MGGCDGDDKDKDNNNNNQSNNTENNVSGGDDNVKGSNETVIRDTGVDGEKKSMGGVVSGKDCGHLKVGLDHFWLVPFFCVAMLFLSCLLSYMYTMFVVSCVL